MDLSLENLTMQPPSSALSDYASNIEQADLWAQSFLGADPIDPPPVDGKDDNTTVSKVIFAILASATLAITFLALYNGYLLFKTGRLKRNIPLALF